MKMLKIQIPESQLAEFCQRWKVTGICLLWLGFTE